MATLLKDLYSPVFFERFATVLHRNIPGFDGGTFRRMIFAQGWDSMELKQRIRHIATVLRQVLPTDFGQAAASIARLIEDLRREPITSSSFEFLFFPDFVELYGLDDLEASVAAMEATTQYVSCEFAVRPFLIRYGDRMVRQMHQWSRHPHANVRRLASEGMRPRLPWAMAVPALKKDPAPILPILENLKADPSEFVRRSVANNLNDISKDWPELVLDIAARWKGVSLDTDAVVRHASRTLLKRGHPVALALFDLHADPNVQADDFAVLTRQVPMGGSVQFSFRVTNIGDAPRKIRLEYGLDFLRQNGSWSRKVFKISEREFQPGETAQMERRQSFRPITTRRYYTGVQRLALIVNGEEKGVLEFELTAE